MPDGQSLGAWMNICTRREELHTPTQWSDRWVLAREAFDRFWANYCYLFMDGGWLCSDGGGWTPVVGWLE